MLTGPTSVNRERYARLKEIVAGALALSGADRPVYLAETCGLDTRLRVDVEALLAAVVRAELMYEDPALLVDGARVTMAALEHLDGLSLPYFPPLTATLRRDPVDDFRGTKRYTVLRRIGAGGMGVVYEVHDVIRDQLVALKTLRHHSANDIYQLKHEFRNLADAAHLNLVSLYDLVVDDERYLFTMELIDGRTFVDDARQPPEGWSRFDRLRHTLPQLIEGVLELHRRGLQHRDIKPSNVLVTRQGRVVLLDFGLTSGSLREEQQIAGTPAYLSPEQCRSEVSDRSDWYSVGATLYHAISGQPPFDGPLHQLLEQKTTGDPVPLEEVAPDAPADLAGVCMALLHPDPARRLSGREALERTSSRDRRGPDGQRDRPEVVFVGREPSLGVLAAAFADVKAGRCASVIIHGPSGIGKTALVQHFVDEGLAGEDVLFLRGRCHEHESIPYNGLDGVIDALTRHLGALPAAVVSALLPDDIAALVRLFPVMRVLGVEAVEDQHDVDPIAFRRRAFAAFRGLLARVAGRRPVVIDIDDFHWVDQDSVRWVSDLLRPPSPAGLLVVISFRSEELDGKPFLRALIERVDLGERLTIPLAPMSSDEVHQLVDALTLGRELASSGASADIMRDSGGNPLLVDALVRHVALGARHVQPATLDEMLERRLAALPTEARLFLETLVICGRPVLPSRIFEACGFDGDERPLVACLRAAHLVRNSRSADRVEMYHDRVRETLASRISPDSARRAHNLMAQVMTAHGDDDPEALFEHYRGAGHAALAAGQAAAAAARASAVLAFDLAATLYRHALHLDPDAARHAGWRVGLARALENAGRPVDAAETYLEVSRQASTTDQIEWRRKAAELFLIGGQIDRGLAVSDEVLRSVGLRLAGGPRRAIASLALRRLQLAWRGLDFDANEPSRIPPGDLLRIDACWSLSAGLAMVDPIRAAAFNVRQLLRALEVGDSYRVARALALEAGFSLVGTGAGVERSRRFSQRASALAEHVGQHYVSALTALWSGIAAFLTGRWRTATELCAHAATTLREECTGVIWELNMAHNFFLGSLVSQGELREVAHHLPALLQAAAERGNAYLELELRTRMILVWLAADDPDGAERRATDVVVRWSHRGFQRQHFNHLLTRVQVALYQRRARDAWALMCECEAALRPSLFRRVQHTRLEAAIYGSRCALAMAATGIDAPRMRAIALQCAARIERERAAWATPSARAIRATVAWQQGDAVAAVAGLKLAIHGFGAADMHLYEAACRHRLAAIVGGDEGRALQAEADRWMVSQEVRDPAALTQLVTPGL